MPALVVIPNNISYERVYMNGGVTAGTYQARDALPMGPLLAQCG